jgi:two-component system NtrC family sensor kinase
MAIILSKSNRYVNSLILFRKVASMPKHIHRINSSLTGKLVIAISVLILLGTSLSMFAIIRAEEKNSMSDTLAHLSSFAEMMRKSLRYDMLTGRREGIQETLQFFGTSESVEGVRIFDHSGRIFYASASEEVGRSIAKTSFSCTGCHNGDGEPLQALLLENRWAIYENPDSTRVMTLAEPIYNEPDCYTASCHAHGREQKVLGVLLTDFSLQTIDNRISSEVVSISLYIVLMVAFIAAILSIILWRIVLKPLAGLTTGMERVSSGNIEQKVDIFSNDEIGKAASTFNSMTDELKIARKRMEKWTQSLEEEVAQKTREIKRTQEKLIQAEKLASLGRLSADVSHEIRNPLSALGGFGRRLLRIVTEKKQKRYAEIIVSEADRLERVLGDVLSFSREARFHFEKVSVNEVIEKSVNLFRENCEEQSINIKVLYETDLPVLIEKDQVECAVNNLISNAVDAMPDGGTLTITTQKELAHDITYVAVNISDTGDGIPEEMLPIVFEPFHTTKKIGHGTGLGLTISRKIAEEHGGFIQVKNRSEKGLIVSMFFPYQSDEELQRVPCWEYMQCGRDVNDEIKCPAYPHFGQVCWAVAGTLCAGKVQGTFAQKIDDCRNCRFYKRVKLSK